MGNNDDRAKGKGNEFKGKAKETTGKVTGNDDLEAEGKTDQMKGKGQGAMADVKDKAGDLKDKV